jgi:hypothetical protein
MVAGSLSYKKGAKLNQIIRKKGLKRQYLSK